MAVPLDCRCKTASRFVLTTHTQAQNIFSNTNLDELSYLFPFEETERREEKRKNLDLEEAPRSVPRTSIT